MKINKPTVFIVLTILLLIFGAYYVLGITFQNDITPEDVWQISQTNGLSAEINWQLRIPCLRMVAENPNNLISSVGTTVAVHRNCLTHSREVIALNSVDGNVLWRTDVSPEVYVLKSDSQKYYGLEGDRIVSFDSNGKRRISLVRLFLGQFGISSSERIACMYLSELHLKLAPMFLMLLEMVL